MPRLFGMVLIAWAAGLQMAIGYMAAPILFTHLDQVTAGHLAGLMLTWAEVIGLVLMAVVSIMVSQRVSARILLVVAMVAQLIQLGVLNPKMAALKAVGLQAAHDHAQFMQLHGISQGLFMLGVMCLLIWLGLQSRQTFTDK